MAEETKRIALYLQMDAYQEIADHAQSIGLSVTNTIRLLCKQALKAKESVK